MSFILHVPSDWYLTSFDMFPHRQDPTLFAPLASPVHAGSQLPSLGADLSPQEVIPRAAGSKAGRAWTPTADFPEPKAEPQVPFRTEEGPGTPDRTKSDQYTQKLLFQERVDEAVKLAIKPFYLRRDITKDEYKAILRKAVLKVCNSRSGRIHPDKIAVLVEAYVEKYQQLRRVSHRRGGDGARPGSLLGGLELPDLDKYLEKLRLQRRADEAVKRAMRPFYQKMHITKEEYKEILRRSVPKVCRGSGGEIDPSRVADMVRRYVRRYRCARDEAEVG